MTTASSNSSGIGAALQCSKQQKGIGNSKSRGSSIGQGCSASNSKPKIDKKEATINRRQW